MVKEFYAYVSVGIKDYNPPDYYRTLSSIVDANKFKQEFYNNYIIGQKCTHSLDNNMGKVVITASNELVRERCNYILIEVRDTILSNYPIRSHYVGVIDKVNNLSLNQIEITYTIDWFTSYALNYWYGQASLPKNIQPSLKAGTMLYRRLSDGEFTYSDEGLVPVSNTISSSIVKATAGASTFYIYDKDGTKVTYDAYSGNLFYKSLMTAAFYVVYNVTSTNQLIKAIVVATPRHFDGGLLGANIAYMLTTLGISEAYDPANLFFVGIIPLAPQFVIRGLKRHEASAFNSTLCYGTYTEDNLNHPLKNLDLNLYVDSENVCTYSNKLRIELGDGYSLYDVPFGKSLPLITDTTNKFTITPYLSSSLSAPLITFKINNTYYAESSTTITIPIYKVSIIADTEASYRAQERQYHQSMLSLQSQNELFSGIVGGFNQGAMISAFSRNQTSTGTSKGIIGGGIAIAGAIANYFYEDLYANKQATNIFDKYNKCKPDVLAQDGSLIYELLCLNSGIKEYKYDTVTVTNIQAYQARFGYQTQKVENNVDLKSFEGYVQADVIFGVESVTEGGSTFLLGLRTEVERYIKDMFNYGVWFTHTT